MATTTASTFIYKGTDKKGKAVQGGNTRAEQRLSKSTVIKTGNTCQDRTKKAQTIVWR